MTDCFAPDFFMPSFCLACCSQVYGVNQRRLQVPGQCARLLVCVAPVPYAAVDGAAVGPLSACASSGVFIGWVVGWGLVIASEKGGLRGRDAFVAKVPI